MKMEMTVANFRKHTADLAKAFDIDLLFNKDLKREQAMALILNEEAFTFIERMLGCKRKTVMAVPIEDETGYAVVMHEIGHHLAPNGIVLIKEPKPGCHPRDRFTYRAAQLVAETEAWEWARYYTEQVFVWTVGMESVRRFAIATYEEGRRTGR